MEALSAVILTLARFECQRTPPRPRHRRDGAWFAAPPTGTAADRSAAATVFERSMVTVMGPTPPGTGVIQEATSFTASKSTSPTMRLPLLREGSGTRLFPTR